MKKLENLVYGKYHEYDREPFAPDATGYVEQKKLIRYDTGWDYMTEDEDGNATPIDGYKLFYADDAVYIVKEAAIWYEVEEDDRFGSGWSTACGNATAGCGAPDAYAIVPKTKDDIDFGFYDDDDDDEDLEYYGDAAGEKVNEDEKLVYLK